MIRACIAAGVLVVFLAPPAAPRSSEVVLTEGTDFAIALSPDGSRLAMDLQGTLWLLPSEGGKARPLTDGLGDDRLPDWSPDGSRIVFQSFREGTWDLWSIAPDGSDAKPLTQDRFDDREPVWSPDGNRIAFASDRSGSYDVWTIDVASGELTRVTDDPANDYMPAWSPDGKLLAFVSDRGGEDAESLWRVALAGGEEVELASVSGGLASPAWSPDGEHILMRRLERRPVTLMGSRFDEGVASDLVGVASEGGDLVALTRGEDVFPFRVSWTPGGTMLYTADGGIRRRDGKTAREILSADPETLPFEAAVTVETPSYPKRPAGVPVPGETRSVLGIVRPVLSPDGSMLAFAALGDLWVLPAEGGTPIPLTRDEFLDSDPAWSPEGRFIVYSSDRAGTMDLWVKETGSSPRSGERRLTDAPGAEVAPAWSPDGRSIAYLDERNDLLVVPAEGGSPRRLRNVHGGGSLPSWSPDGRHLALGLHQPLTTRFREGANRIGIVSLATGETRILELPGKSFGTRGGDGPGWSPDGRQIAFALDAGLWVLPVSPDGEPAGEPRRVVDEPADFPSWSPDSKAIVYLASDRLARVDLTTGASSAIPFQLHYHVRSARGRLVIQGVRLIDGTGSPARENVDIVIAGNRIEAVLPGGSVSDETARVVSGRGRTAIPGLIEMHCHLSLPSWGRRHGRVFLAYGVTSVRTPSASLYRVVEEKESVASGRRIGPRLFYTGYSFDGDRVYYDGALAIDDQRELEKELDRAARLEVDLVKAYVRLPDTLQKALIDEAHERGLFVTSHEIYPAVGLGIDGIEHLWGTSRRGFSPKITDLRRSYDDVVQLVSRSAAFLTPTLLIHGGFHLALAREPEILEDRRWDLFPPWVVDGLAAPGAEEVSLREQSMQPLFDTVGAMNRAGARLVAGTDSPLVPYGLGLILEIEQMSEAGMGALGAIRAATQVAAEALGLSQDLGTIEEGKLADLVLLEGDPVRDIRHLRHVREVIVDGRMVTLDQLLKDP